MTERWLHVVGASTVVLACTLPLNGASDMAPAPPPIVERFLAGQPQAPRNYTAWRRLEAASRGQRMHGWLEAWTTYDAAEGFRYLVVDQGGSDYMRNHVLKAVLNGEAEAFRSGKAARARFAAVNYEFTLAGTDGSGLLKLLLKPRRKDVMLVDGAIFVNPESAELVRVEGALARNPSIWTRRVTLMRQYEQVGGVQVPVRVESSAQVMFVGRSTFAMTYSYEAVNGRQVRTSAEARRQLTPMLAGLLPN